MDALEEIKQLKARYFRTLDTKDWEGMRAVFADDLVMDTSSSGGGVVEGADKFMAFLSQVLADVVSVHHGHMPEIELTSPTTARGIWAMNDLLRWPNGRELRGYGHYHETYALIDGRWKIIVPGARRGEIELFDLSRDPAEANNLAADRPDLVQSLKAKVQAWNATLPNEYIKSAASDDAN